MQIELLKPYLGRSVGAVVDFPTGSCVELIRRGIAKPLNAEAIRTKPARKVRTK